MLDVKTLKTVKIPDFWCSTSFEVGVNSRGLRGNDNFWRIELPTWMTEILSESVDFGSRIHCLHCKRNLNILTKHFNLKYSQDHDVFYWPFLSFVSGQWILIWSLPRLCLLRRFVLDKVIVALLCHAAQQFHGLQDTWRHESKDSSQKTQTEHKQLNQGA